MRDRLNCPNCGAPITDVECPYCGDETGWYNPVSDRDQSDLKNNRREHCPKCGKRVFAREGWIINQPPEEVI